MIDKIDLYHITLENGEELICRSYLPEEGTNNYVLEVIAPGYYDYTVPKEAIKKIVTYKGCKPIGIDFVNKETK